MKSRQPAKKESKQAAGAKKENSNSYLVKIIKNIVILFAAVILVKTLKGSKEDSYLWNDGYNWYFTALIEENLKTMKQFKTLTSEQKLESKVGFN